MRLMPGQSFHQSPLVVLPLVFLQSFCIELFELPGTYLFRQIRCDQHRNELGLPSDADICRDPIVQKRYSTDLAIYMTLLSILSIIVSGPFGTLSDRKGRKFVIATSAFITLIGELWTVVCSALAPLRRPSLLYVAAVLKGFGGSYAVMKAAELALISESSPPSTRSFFLGLVLVMGMAATAIAPLVGGVLVNGGHYTTTFVVGMAVWCVHLAYTLIVLKEPPREKSASPGGQEENPNLNRQTEVPTTRRPTIFARLRSLLALFIMPILKLGTSSTLLILASIDFLMFFGVAAFIILIPWSDSRFGLPPSQAGIISATMATSRALSVLCILPFAKYTYGHFIHRRTGIQLGRNYADGEVEEDAQLLIPSRPSLDSHLSSTVDENEEEESARPRSSVEDENTTVDRAEEEETRKNNDARRLSAAQELWICRFSFVLDMLGMLLVSFSRSPVQVGIAVAIGALGAPAVPSIQSLVTMVTPDAELGQVLAALTIVEGIVLTLRNPILFGLYNATLQTADGTVWWCAAALLGLCGIGSSFLTPGRFVPAPPTPGVRAA